MRFDSLHNIADASAEDQAWIARYREIEAVFPAMGPLLEPFSDLCTRLIGERFGQFSVVAAHLPDGDLSVAVLPFAIPVMEEVIDLLTEERIIEDDDGVWSIDTPDEPELPPHPLVDPATLGIAGTPLGDRYSMVRTILDLLDEDQRARVVDWVFTMVEEHFMDHPAIAAYYDTFELSPELASVIVPLFEVALVNLRTSAA